jgi:hypothetical protein
MDWLIEFIAGNLMFIVIALGILTSLFKKANEGKGDGRQAGRPPAGGPPAGGPMAGSPLPGQTREDSPSDNPGPFDRDFPRGWFDDEEEEEEFREPERPVRPAVQERAQDPEVRPQSRTPRIQPEFEPVHRPAVEPVSMSGAADRKVPVPPSSPASDDMSPIYRPESAEDMSRQALQGMIWSEVYGPPLAKRSMMARLRRNG